MCTLSSGLGGLWTFYDPLLIKPAQPENLFSLEMFFSLYFLSMSASESIKQSYISHRAKVQWVITKKKQLAQRSDMVNSKAMSCFSYIPTMLTNALSGAQWIRDMGT